MITVLHYTPGFNSGGIESRLLDWYRNIDRSKIRFVLIKLNDIDNTENIKEFVNLGGKYYNLAPFSSKTAFSFVKGVHGILVKENVDIVHVHDVNSGFFVLREAKRIGIKCRILHSRTTSYLPNEKNVMIKTLLRKTAPKFANSFFACSVEAGLWGIGEKYKDVIRIIKNGIQIENFIYNPAIREKVRNQLGVYSNIVIGTIGRLSEQKNIPFLLDVFQELLKINKDYRLIIVGDGDRKILYDYFDSNPISDYVSIIGNKKNVWDYYMAFDIFCGTSLYEGFGTTAIEAQATGLPTIISDAFPDTVVVTDYVQRLSLDIGAAKWAEIINTANTAGLKKRDPHCISYIDNAGYSAEKVAKELESFYLSHA